ncbi:hypothetical protein AAKU58_002046 [Oxalobacteraceae bacterium GrIS 1.18]
MYFCANSTEFHSSYIESYMKRIVGLILLLLSLFLTGCASVPMAPADQDVKAKQFSPLENKAALYVYRNDSMAGTIPITVAVNGQTLGEAVSKSYFELNLLPGTYALTSYEKNESGLSKTNDANLAMTVEAGKIYFVHLDVGAGLLFAHSSLQQVDAITGQAGVAESNLIANSSSGIEAALAKKQLATGQMAAAGGNAALIFGASAVTVERLAMKQNCQPVVGASLISSKGPIENYQVKCSDGNELAAHCEYRQCSLRSSK